MNKKTPVTIHLIGNAHLDPVWLWRWTEGYAETLGLARTMLDLLHEFPDFKFTRSSAQSYKWVEETAPELFEQIKECVYEGRWDCVGGMWEQPDMNLPSAESLLRQGIYGQRYFHEKFGRISETGYCVDSFGHPAGLPTILKAVSMKAYVFSRPSHTMRPDVPDLFRWEAPGGKSIIGIHISNYGIWGPTLLDRMAYALEVHTQSIPHVAYMFGLGDHGGGPSRKDLRQLRAVMKQDWQAAEKAGAMPDEIGKLKKRFEDTEIEDIRFSTYAEFTPLLETFKDKLTLLKNQPIQHYGQGTYTSVSAIKKNNRTLENSLFTAEAAMATALLHKIEIPDLQSDLDDAWTTLLFNQFHDIGAGSAYQPAVDDQVQHLHHGRHLADRVANRALQRIFQKIDASRMPYAAMIYNPLPWPVKALVSVRPLPIDSDESGTTVPYQFISGPMLRNNQSNAAVVLDVPAMGIRTVYSKDNVFRPCSLPASKSLSTGGFLSDEYIDSRRQIEPAFLDATLVDQWNKLNTETGEYEHQDKSEPCWMENDALKVEFDEQGRLKTLLHKESGVNMLSAPVTPVVMDDPRDAWGHQLEEQMPHSFHAPLEPMESECIGLIDNGPVTATVATQHTWRNSSVRIEWKLTDGLDYLDATVQCDWHDRHTMLKLEIPTIFAEGTSTVDTALSTPEVSHDGIEHPCQKWIDRSGEYNGAPAGLAVANDAKYGCSFIGEKMYVSILRTAHMGYLDFSREHRHLYAERFNMDQGIQSFQLRFLAHLGKVKESRIQRCAMELNIPPVVINGGIHSGELPDQLETLCVAPDSIQVLAVKKSYNDDSIILRVWESSGEACTSQIRHGKQEVNVEFAAHELKTLQLHKTTTGLEISEISALELS